MAGCTELLKEQPSSPYDFLFLAPCRTHSHAHDQERYAGLPAEKSKERTHLGSSSELKHSSNLLCVPPTDAVLASAATYQGLRIKDFSAIQAPPFMHPHGVKNTLHIQAGFNHHQTMTTRIFHHVTSCILYGFKEIYRFGCLFLEPLSIKLLTKLKM
jgi:hypothetical protein